MHAKTKDILSALFWLLFAVYIAIESYYFDLGKGSMPGPGYFPFSAALLIGIISLLFLLKTLRKKTSKEIPISLPKGRWQNVVLSLVTLIVYVFLLNWIGFVFCTFLLGVFFLRVVGQHRWFNTLIEAVIMRKKAKIGCFPAPVVG